MWSQYFRAYAASFPLLCFRQNGFIWLWLFKIFGLLGESPLALLTVRVCISKMSSSTQAQKLQKGNHKCLFKMLQLRSYKSNHPYSWDIYKTIARKTRKKIMVPPPSQCKIITSIIYQILGWMAMAFSPDAKTSV
jgi:hypothetical protein